MPATPHENLRLESLSGPIVAPPSLRADHPAIIGRAEDCAVRLDHPSVSRRHAQLAWIGGGWTLTDLGSRHGTFLHDRRLDANRQTPLRDGDVLTVGPWALRARIGEGTSTIMVKLSDARTPTIGIRTRTADELGGIAEKRLSMLLHAAEAIHRASSEPELAQVLLSTVLEGGGYSRAALLRMAAPYAHAELIAEQDAKGQKPLGQLVVSTSLVKAASRGVIASLGEADHRYAPSIMSTSVRDAICVPVRVGNAIDAYLYAEIPANAPPALADATSFCAAIAHLCGLAMANLRRHDLAQRELLMTRDLEHARDVQQRILPPPRGTVAGIDYALHARAGAYVGGDLAGIRALPDGRGAIFVGDVSGHGIGPALLMASLQAHLAALLDRGIGLSDLIHAANDFLHRSSGTGEFATLWMAYVDPRARAVEYIDAGHGYALLARSADPVWLDGGGGPPLGVVGEQSYASGVVTLAPGERIVLVSDGVVEQANAQGDLLGKDRVAGAVAGMRDVGGDLDVIMAEIRRFADGTPAGDDVTLASFSIPG